MRLSLVIAALLVLATGCPGDSSKGLNAGADSAGEEADPGQAAPPGASAACSVDADCEAVASSCCECPTFALPVSEGVGGLCEDVACTEPLECPAQQAVCSDSGTCELACAPVICELSCENGFARDAAGCGICACNPAPVPTECTGDLDCTQVAADCCGCSAGGEDTAVPGAEAADFVDALGCTGAEVCPDVDVCDSAEVPTCSFGRCMLVNPALDGLGIPDVCGTSEAPTCPDGSDCVLNPRDYPMVGAAGLGVCVPQ